MNLSVIPRGAVVATHNRPAELARCVAALADQVDAIVVVDNASDPPVDLPARMPGMRAVRDGAASIRMETLRDPEQPPNLSRLWNLGLDWIADYFRGGDIDGYDVAIVNDDATVPPGWFDAMSAAMRELGADAASSDTFGQEAPGYRRLWRGADVPMSVMTRLTGAAFLLRGEWDGARLDESMRWNFSDDDISYRARLAGGLVHVGGFRVPNEHEDTTTVGVLAEQAGRDRATFVAKHGRQPW